MILVRGISHGAKLLSFDNLDRVDVDFFSQLFLCFQFFLDVSMNFFVQGQCPKLCILCYVLNFVSESSPKVCLLLFLTLLIHLSSGQR